MSKNHPKIYTKPPNGGYGNKQRDLALFKTSPRYSQKGRVMGNSSEIKLTIDFRSNYKTGVPMLIRSTEALKMPHFGII